MNSDAKIFNKIIILLNDVLTESNNTSERSFTMTKLASSQGFKDGSTFTNQ
jgi:uncharacterized protein YaaQ